MEIGSSYFLIENYQRTLNKDALESCAMLVGIGSIPVLRHNKKHSRLSLFACPSIS